MTIDNIQLCGIHDALCQLRAGGDSQSTINVFYGVAIGHISAALLAEVISLAQYDRLYRLAWSAHLYARRDLTKRETCHA